jgi:protein-S-isoprenylcysteine O-methyltransferase Ste14
MNESLFRHRLAVILGAFLVAAGLAYLGNKLGIAALSDYVGLERSFLCTAPVLLLALALRVAGEARLGSAVYGQRASARVVTSGIFSAMRHPLYVGTWLFFVAVCAPYLSPAILGALAVAFALALRAIATHEEGALHEAHGDAWTRYASVVPRVGIIPKKVEADDVKVTARAIASAFVGNLGFAALAMYRIVVATVGTPQGLRALTLLLLVVWLVVLLVRRARRT